MSWFFLIVLSAPVFALAPGQLQQTPTRRSVTLTGLAGAIGGFVLTGEEAPASASGVSFEEAAKNAEKYRVKPTCTPTRPEYCSERYQKMIDPRAKLSAEELARRDDRNKRERESLRSMLRES